MSTSTPIAIETILNSLPACRKFAAQGESSDGFSPLSCVLFLIGFLCLFGAFAHWSLSPAPRTVLWMPIGLGAMLLIASVYVMGKVTEAWQAEHDRLEADALSELSKLERDHPKALLRAALPYRQLLQASADNPREIGYEASQARRVAEELAKHDALLQQPKGYLRAAQLLDDATRDRRMAERLARQFDAAAGGKAPELQSS